MLTASVGQASVSIDFALKNGSPLHLDVCINVTEVKLGGWGGQSCSASETAAVVVTASN